MATFTPSPVTSNAVELFDCICDLVWKGPRNYEPTEFDKIKLTKFNSVPPLQELIPDLIAKNNWTYLIKLLVDSKISSKCIYSLLLARSVYYSNKEAVEMILESWPWHELVVSFCPLYFWQNTELSFLVTDLEKSLTVPLNRLMEMFIQLVSVKTLDKLCCLDLSDCILDRGRVNDQLKFLVAESVLNHKRENEEIETTENYVIKLHRELQRDENYICEEEPLNLDFLVRDNTKLKVVFTFVTMTVSQIKEQYVEQIRKVYKIGQVSTIWYNDLFKNEFLYYSEKLPLLLAKLPNIFYLKLSVFRRQALDALIDTISNTNKGLLFLYICFRNKQLYPPHINSLSNSRHMSTLQTLGLCVTDLSLCMDELVILITKISGTVKILQFEQCKINTSMAVTLFKAAETCKNLVSLDIRNNRINPVIYADAAILAGLPHFILFCASVSSWDICGDLNLSRAFQEYRSRHWPVDQFPTRVHIILEEYFEITDKDPSEGESGYDESD